MKIAIAQINTTVGAFDENAAKVVARSREAAAAGAELLLLPEQTLPGYPARDFLQDRGFVARGEEALEGLIRATAGDGPTLVVGHAAPHPKGGVGLHNGAVVAGGGRILQRAQKILLPTYDVFDEARYFDPGEEVCVFVQGGVRIGVTICEDLWNDEVFWGIRRYARDPLEEAVRAGAQIVLNLSASPYALSKGRLRERMLAAAARRHGVPIVYCNLVGGNDSLIFDGQSLVIDAAGEILTRGRAFEEELLIVEVEPAPARLGEGRAIAPGEREAVGAAAAREGFADLAGPPDEEALGELEQALVLGLRDYVRKIGFREVVIGISGGIDSALTAALAVEALGPERVLGVTMPSQVTASISTEDAGELAARLGMRLEIIPIEDAVQTFRHLLEGAGVGGGAVGGLTLENLQARSRGVILMAVANDRGALLLTTGNKSELAVGYCTLYGDMAGGLSLLGDLPKTTVYALARHLNRERERIPVRTIARPPTAELREDQTDQDSLPPYEVLDRILRAYVVERRTFHEIVEGGEEEAVVREVLEMVLRSEFKRRQAAPSLKVSPRAFGEGWRFPLAHGYRPGGGPRPG